MKLLAKHFKAISWYAKNYNFKPQLSTPPVIYFKNEHGTVVSRHLEGIMLEYNAWNEEDKKIRARERASEKRHEQNQAKVL